MEWEAEAAFERAGYMLSTLHDSELRKVGSRGLVYEFQAPEFEHTPLISWREGADRDGGGGRCNNGVAVQLFRVWWSSQQHAHMNATYK